MRIISIKFKNHQVLGDFMFDFQVDGNVRDFSLLVGENGCGKTIFLEEVFGIVNGGMRLWNDGTDRDITISLTPTEKTIFGLNTDIITLSYVEQRGTHWQRIKVADGNGADLTNQLMPKIQDGSFNKIFKGAYSTVEINFTAKEVDAVRATNIDAEELPKSKSNPDLASEIAQLLVDIKSQDDAEWGSWGRTHAGEGNAIVPILGGKLERFKNAYAKMFVGKGLYDIRPDGNRHRIFFRDTARNVEFDISRLSSGEKQVVYRAGYLLRNLKNLNGGIILIDEPELSLHPKWQIKYLDFLKELFQNENGTITIQFLIATHSPFILKSALKDYVGVFVFYKDNLGKISAQNTHDKGFGFFKWSPSLGEINYMAYGLPTIEFHDELYGSLHEKFISAAPDEAEAKRRSCVKIFDYEVLAGSDNTKQTKNWSELRGGIQQSAYGVTLSTFIRNKIHHPESTQIESYTDVEFNKSIENMIALIKIP